MHTACSSSHLGGGLPQSMLGYLPWPGPGHPLGCGLETPWPDPSTFPLGVGLEIPPARPNFSPGCGPGDPPPQPDPSTSPLGVGLEIPPLTRPLNLPPGVGLETPPPPTCEQNSWHTFLKILPCPNFVVGGNNGSRSRPRNRNSWVHRRCD